MRWLRRLRCRLTGHIWLWRRTPSGYGVDVMQGSCLRCNTFIVEPAPDNFEQRHRYIAETDGALIRVSAATEREAGRP